MELIRRLETIPLFEGLPGKQHAALVDISVPRSYEKGQKVFSEGDEGSGLFVILDGYVKVFKVSPEGSERWPSLPVTVPIFYTIFEDITGWFKRRILSR
jgi:CRP/FNR family transcriptional regulator, dissimilatory nitrate respiration regulator